MVLDNADHSNTAELEMIYANDQKKSYGTGHQLYFTCGKKLINLTCSTQYASRFQVLPCLNPQEPPDQMADAD